MTCAAAYAQQPRIDSLSASEGPIGGGTVVAINGAGFTSAAVKLDNRAIAPISQTETEVRLQMPAHDNGYALIQVGSAAVEFLYLPPRLDELPPGYITTVAGVGKHLGLEQPAARALVSPWGIAVEPDGAIDFISQAFFVFRITPDGILHHVAGTLGAVDFGVLGDEGAARDATIGFARDVARDEAGNLYVNDSARFRIRKIDAVTQIITTMAGTGTKAFSGDGGPATNADLLEPTHLTVKPDGTIYFLDGNVRVRRIRLDGIIATVAGNGTVGESGDGGPALAAQLNVGVNDLGQVALDRAGNLFILERDGQRVRRVDAASGTISTFASRDARGQPFSSARALAIDGSGNVYVGTQNNINEFDPAGRLIDMWGSGHGFSEDGADAKGALIGNPQAMAILPNGDILYSDSSPSRLRKINRATGKLETVAGIAPVTPGVPGRSVAAQFSSPSGDLAFMPNGDLIFADGEAKWIHRLDVRNGTIASFAGNGTFIGGYDELPALATSVSTPVSIDIDDMGTVRFADKQAIRSIDANGVIHRIIGVPGPCGFTGDGAAARDAQLCQPEDVIHDRAGNIYIADTNNNRIRRVDAKSGVITTIAGSGTPNGFEGYGHGSFCGDGGPAKDACLNTPISLALLDDGTMYINDFYNNPKIRKVTPDGRIASLAAWPQASKLIVGPGQSIFAQGGTRIYRADDDRIRTVAGTGTGGFSGDGGPANLAMFAPGEAEYAHGLAIDAEGNLFVHDGGNRRIRAIRYGAVLAPPNATIQAVISGGTIQATVFDSAGFTARGARVDFSAPSTGASCTLSNAFAITDATGIATVRCSPNCIAGNYQVTARPLTSTSTTSVSLVNPGGPCKRRAVRH